MHEMLGTLLDSSAWENLLTGLGLLLAGFVAFTLRIR